MIFELDKMLKNAHKPASSEEVATYLQYRHTHRAFECIPMLLNSGLSKVKGGFRIRRQDFLTQTIVVNK